jgi:hypothetical protein
MCVSKTPNAADAGAFALSACKFDTIMYRTLMDRIRSNKCESAQISFDAKIFSLSICIFLGADFIKAGKILDMQMKSIKICQLPQYSGYISLAD